MKQQTIDIWHEQLYDTTKRVGNIPATVYHRMSKIKVTVFQVKSVVRYSNRDLDCFVSMQSRPQSLFSVCPSPSPSAGT